MIHGVRLVYPKAAKRAHIPGVVKLNIVITKTGEVGDLHVISGDPTLVPRKVKILERTEIMGDGPTRSERPWEDVTH